MGAVDTHRGALSLTLMAFQTVSGWLMAIDAAPVTMPLAGLILIGHALLRPSDLHASSCACRRGVHVQYGRAAGLLASDEFTMPVI